MSDSTDAYSHVTVQFADGRSLTGKPPMYGDARSLLLQLEEYSKTSEIAQLDAIVARFCGTTGIAETDLIQGRTLGEVIEAMQRFFYHRRSAMSAPVPANAAPTGS